LKATNEWGQIWYRIEGTVKETLSEGIGKKYEVVDAESESAFHNNK
jgi:hypothetical protein